MSKDTVEIRARQAVNDILDDLRDRQGISDEWDRIDEEIRAEILDVWVGIVSAAMSFHAEDFLLKAISRGVAPLERKEPEYGMPVHMISPAAERRLKEAEEWAEKSKDITGLVGQSKPRF